jgi:hypothetical protein
VLIELMRARRAKAGSTNGKKVMLSVRKALPVSGIALFALTCSYIVGIADERLDARKVAQSAAELYTNAYDKHDPKAISMLFVSDGVFLPPDGSPIV